jgi:hypothetical protein
MKTPQFAIAQLGAAQGDGAIARHSVRFSFVDVFPMKPRSYCR